MTADERDELKKITSQGKHRSQELSNSLILLDYDEGDYQNQRSTNVEIAKVLNISMREIDRAKRRFVVDGLDVALNGRKESRVYKKK